MMETMKSTVSSTKYWLQMFIPSITTFVFLGYAFVIATVVTLSIIPVYLENRSVPKTRYILTTARLNNYVLQTNPSLVKRDITHSQQSMPNTIELLAFDEAQLMMNTSITYALEQQLKLADSREKFNMYILQMRSYTNTTNQMNVTLDIMIVYIRECMSCDKHRQSIIFQQLCSHGQLLTPIRFSIPTANLAYTLSDPITVYTPFISIENITIVTRIVSSLQISNQVDIVQTNVSKRLSNKFLANTYTLLVTTTKSNYLATLDETITQVSAGPNTGPVPLAGATTMYSKLEQSIERQTQISNGSDILNVTINNIVLLFWYSNSTIQIVVDFLIEFPTSCDGPCMNQRSIQLRTQLASLSNVQVQIQPANLTDGQVQILTNGIYILYNYSLTSQIISNFTGTIINAIPPTLTIIY